MVMAGGVVRYTGGAVYVMGAGAACGTVKVVWAGIAYTAAELPPVVEIGAACTEDAGAA